MELFSIPRYNENETEQQPLQEDKLLKKLLKKAKKRKIEQGEILQDLKANEDVSADIVSNHFENEVKNNLITSTSENPIKECKNEFNNEEFKILGDDTFKKKQKVNMILPPWLANPAIISSNINEDTNADILENFNYLSPVIIQNLEKMNIRKLFPVQKEVIPYILNAHSKPFPFKPRDICVSAPTGSGKTLAFSIPLIQLLMRRVDCKIRALVILPVNELAIQVYKVINALAKGTVLSVCLLSKKFAISEEQNKIVKFHNGKYYSKVDIIVTTPGRLVEHLHSTKGFCLKNLKFLVVDEADRIMEQIHFNWLYHLDEHVRKTSEEFFTGVTHSLSLHELINSFTHQPHKLLYSATLSHDPEKLMNLKLFQPKLFTTAIVPLKELNEKLSYTDNKNQIHDTDVREIDNDQCDVIGKYTTPPELTEKYCMAPVNTKPLTLFALIKEYNWKKFLCFTNSVESAHRLAQVLKYFFEKETLIEELSASLTAKKRTKILDDFMKGNIQGLICSDALARGIDIPEVDVVISYDVPRHIKTYIHRIGRTARAGRHGTAITILTEEEFKKFKNILCSAGKHIGEEIVLDSKYEEDYAAQFSQAIKHLEDLLIQERKNEILRKNLSKKKSVLSVNDEHTNIEKINAPLNPLEKFQQQLNIQLELKYESELKNTLPRRFRKKMKTKKKKQNQTA